MAFKKYQNEAFRIQKDLKKAIKTKLDNKRNSLIKDNFTFSGVYFWVVLILEGACFRRNKALLCKIDGQSKRLLIFLLSSEVISP